MWEVLSDYNLPRASRYVEDLVILGECVFYAVLDYTQYTLLDLEVLLLFQMKMSAMATIQISREMNI